jgi:hypothetical protein
MTNSETSTSGRDFRRAKAFKGPITTTHPLTRGTLLRLDLALRSARTAMWCCLRTKSPCFRQMTASSRRRSVCPGAGTSGNHP